METQHGMIEQATEIREYELLNSVGEQHDKSGMRNSLMQTFVEPGWLKRGLDKHC